MVDMFYIVLKRFTKLSIFKYSERARAAVSLNHYLPMIARGCLIFEVEYRFVTPANQTRYLIGYDKK